MPGVWHGRQGLDEQGDTSFRSCPALLLQAGQLGQRSIPLRFPEGWLLDEEGASIRQALVAPTDVAAACIGTAIASADLACGHQSFTLNNLLACLIATDILQVCCLPPRSWLSCPTASQAPGVPIHEERRMQGSYGLHARLGSMRASVLVLPKP